ncbi:hypothetical protein FTO68_04090 [Methanocalculus taiwanensis]|uniref:Uncharacterized protein n=1 Tax=Methanocalculus taiwanensis TaxID=106207 RepID=A0ABD4TIQ3_9EURY|nr:hypothetical protein [Methanocalculus taiwanensis]MCQ1538172.1 hypothetical protein [Methanocalculus taiwanensis]
MENTGTSTEPICEPVCEGDIRDSPADIPRARAASGHEPEYTLEERLFCDCCMVDGAAYAIAGYAGAREAGAIAAQEVRFKGGGAAPGYRVSPGYSDGKDWPGFERERGEEIYQSGINRLSYGIPISLQVYISI